MTIKQNRSRFDIRSSHLVAPHTWIEHPSITRRGPSSSKSPAYHLTNKYRVTHTNHTFFEDNCKSYKINHFTIDDNCITIHNRLITSDSTTNANYSLPDVNHSLDDASYPLHGHNCINIQINYDKQEKTDFTKSLPSDGTPAAPPNDEKLHIINSVQLPDTAPHHCTMDHAEAAADNFTFSPSIADAMEFFQFMKSSSGHASEAGDTISVMSHADELFEDGKIRPLLPSVIHIDGSQIQSDFSNCKVQLGNFPTKGSSEGSLIAHNDETDCGSGGIDTGTIDERLNQKGIDDDQHMMMVNDSLPNFKFMSLSAPASPVRELHGTSDHNEEHGIGQVQSELSRNYQFKRCRSLARAFPNEDSNEQTLEEGQGSLNRKESINIMSKRRTTLQEFLKQEGNHYLKQNQEQLGLKTSPRNNVSNSYEVLKRSLLAPAPINLPQLWPTQERSPSINKKVRPPSPHVVHYTFQKAQAERMKRKTFLPYRPRLLGCLGYPTL